jgi:hypothetical protein
LIMQCSMFCFLLKSFLCPGIFSMTLF